MRSDQRHGPLITIAAASAVCLVFGTVHAFSVFLAPLEQTFGASRSAVSLTYSIALVALTFAVLFGPRLYTVMTTRSIILLATTLGAAGTVISAFAPALWLIWIGYGLVFGAANGLGYGFCLQLSAAAAPGREGLAMGTVTASYALGATLAPAGFLHAMESGGFQTAMITLAAILVTFGGAAASMLALPTRLNVSTDSAPHQVVVSKSRINLMRVTYGAAVASGLMVIGHAAEIARGAEGNPPVWLAPTVVAVFNMAGSLAGGVLTDRIGWPRLLLVLPLGTAAGLGLLMVDAGGSTLIALGLIGTCYGAIIAVYPAAIAKIYGIADSAQIYGRVFIAWGVAGLAAPWLAGALFDFGGSYVLAIGVALLLSLVSAALSRTLGDDPQAR